MVHTHTIVTLPVKIHISVELMAAKTMLTISMVRAET